MKNKKKIKEGDRDKDNVCGGEKEEKRKEKRIDEMKAKKKEK